MQKRYSHPSLGFIIRDDESALLVEKDKFLHLEDSILSADALILLEEIKSVVTMDWKSLIIKGNNLVLTKLMKRIWQLLWEIDWLVEDVSNDLTNLDSVCMIRFSRKANQAMYILAAKGSFVLNS